MEYAINSVDSGVVADNAYEPYGVVHDFFHYTGRECMLSGPYDTGKTFGALQKLNTLMWLYKNLHIMVVRKTYSSLKNSAIQSLFDKVLPDHPDNLDEYSLYGGGTPQSLTVLPTGSVMKFGGMDEPKRVLSAEYDFIFVPQAEELSIDDWEQLMGRANGRAGHSPWPQILGDCNPDVPEHWIMNRPTLKVFHTTHQDNPTIYARDSFGNLIPDENGEPLPTPGGRGRLETLRSMTGLRYKRGYLGLWVGAEGAVYGDFDTKTHVIDRFKIPYEWKKYRVVDFGYTHPFVCQWWAMDEMGKLYLYREMYMTGRTVGTHVMGNEALNGIKYYSEGEKIETTICDHDAEGMATLREYGIKTTKADKRVQVDNLLKDSFKPLNTIQEFPGYVWQNIGNKAESARDEKPIKKGDHGMDGTRYGVMHFDGKKTGKTAVIRYA